MRCRAAGRSDQPPATDRVVRRAEDAPPVPCRAIFPPTGYTGDISTLIPPISAAWTMRMRAFPLVIKADQAMLMSLYQMGKSWAGIAACRKPTTHNLEAGSI